MTSVHLLLLEGLSLLILGLDLSRDFSILPVWARASLGVLAAGGGALLLVPPVRDRLARPRRAPVVVLAAGSALLAALGLVQQEAARRIAAAWDAGAHARLEDRARLILGDFASFLREVLKPIESASIESKDPGAAFDAVARALASTRLPRGRVGFSLYRPDGSLLAWGGNSLEAPRDLLAAAAPDPSYRIAGGEASPRLYAVIAAPQDGLRRVAEFLLGPPASRWRGEASGPSLDFLPSWGRAAPAHVHLGLRGAEGDDLARFFERQGDRYWGRLGREGATTLSLPLRAPGGRSLAVLSLKDLRADRATGAWRDAFRRAGAVVLAGTILLAWFFLARMTLPGMAPSLLVGTSALWLSRWALLMLGADADLPRLSIFDIGLYASPALGGLMRSPADLFLTALAALAQAFLVRRHLILLPADGTARRRRLRGGAIAGLVALLIGGGVALHGLLDNIVLDARLDISRVVLDDHAAPRFLLQASLFLVVASLAVLGLGLFDLAGRCGDPKTVRGPLPGLRSISTLRVPLVLRSVAVVLVLTLLYLPLLHHAYDRLRETFFEDELVPRVVHQKEAREGILRDSLALAGEEDFAAAASFAAEGEGGSGGLAYRLWTATPMAEMGLASSLEIYETGGRLLDRFAVNLAPGLEVPFERAAAAAGGDLVEVPPRSTGIVRKAVLMGSRLIRPARRAPLLAVMTVIDDYDNLPLVGADTGYQRAFMPRSLTRTNPEILRFDPVVAVFGPRLERIYESGGEIPPPSAREEHALEQGGIAWTTDSAGEGQARIVYARGDGVTFALAHPHAGATEILAAYMRLVLLNGFLAAVLIGMARAARRAGARPASPGGTFYGRVTTIFLLTALLPLLALAFFVTRFSAREFSRDLTTTGLASLQVARRVAEDYLALSGSEEGPGLDDDVVFWLSRVVRQDLSIFRGSDLMATSTRELYGSGLLNPRLDGAIYRAIYLDREPFKQSGDPSTAGEELTLSAPMRIDRQGTLGAISIPLAGQRRAIARKAEEVEDAVLISTYLTVLLLAGVAYLVARRVSEPITLLARAARRVAEGDLDVRVAAAAHDEIAILVDAFNRMAGSLREQREDLRRRTEYIEKILRSATTGVVSIDGAGSVITINPAAQQLLGGAPSPPTVGENLPERLARDAALAPLLEALRRALREQVEEEAEVVLRTGDSERRLRAVFIPFAPEEGALPGTIILLEDISEIVRSGRLAAWAEMARRIAHEIKNPLTPIQLSVEHVRRLWLARDPVFGRVLEECLDNIQGQVHELRAIASEFSAYARLPELRREPTPVAAILDDALGPYLKAPPPGIRLTRDVASELPRVLADRAVIARSLVNLIENALQAMPEGGTLSISASELGGAAEADRCVRIRVRDTGHGIEPAMMPRLFEPYFSTKSRGTGLGLAIVRRAVEDHGGTIDVVSSPGAGTTVTLVLPAAPQAGPPDAS